MSARPSPLMSPPAIEKPSSSPPWPTMRNDAVATIQRRPRSAQPRPRVRGRRRRCRSRAVGVGVGHARPRSRRCVAVDVAELGDRRARAVAVRDAVDRQRARRQRADADAAREHAEADDQPPRARPWRAACAGGAASPAARLEPWPSSLTRSGLWPCAFALAFALAQASRLRLLVRARQGAGFDLHALALDDLVPRLGLLERAERQLLLLLLLDAGLLRVVIGGGVSRR